MGRAPSRGRLKARRQGLASTAHTFDALAQHTPVEHGHNEGAPGGRLHAVSVVPDDQLDGAAPTSLPPQELTLHHECIKLTGERLPLGIAYPRFLDVVRRIVPFNHGTLYLAEGAGGSLVPVVVKGNRVDLADQVRFAKGPGLTAWVAQEGRAVVIPHPVHSVDQRPFADKGLRAFVAIPLTEQGRVVAVLALSRAEHIFEAQEFDFLIQSSGQLAATLSRMRLQAQYGAWAHTDKETGLSAHQHFVARVDAESIRARHHASEFCVAVMTLEGAARRESKHVDHLTRTFAERLLRGIRSCDMATLMDDGSFGILLAGVNRETAVRVLKRIATTTTHGVAELTPPAIHLWGGVAACSDAVTSAEEFLARARGDLVLVA